MKQSKHTFEQIYLLFFLYIRSILHFTMYYVLQTILINFCKRDNFEKKTKTCIHKISIKVRKKSCSLLNRAVVPNNSTKEYVICFIQTSQKK